MRKTIERGIAENVLEIALRGKPREPFYMVGRMKGQWVVLRAEKGKLRLMVEDEEGGGTQEMVYDVAAQAGERGERVNYAPFLQDEPAKRHQEENSNGVC